MRAKNSSWQAVRRRPIDRRKNAPSGPAIIAQPSAGDTVDSGRRSESRLDGDVAARLRDLSGRLSRFQNDTPSPYARVIHDLGVAGDTRAVRHRGFRPARDFSG
jgi:hypothetical protein